jgi:hypothetical protein
MSLIRNERTKLFANAIDRISTASLTVGVLAPGAAVFYSTVAVPMGVLVSGSAFWIFVAVALHLFARRVLRGLQ